MAKNTKKSDAIHWKNITIRLGDLIPWDANPRKIQKRSAELLKESWSDFGQVEVIAVGPAFEIYNGHQRLKVLKAEYGLDYQVDARQSSRPLSEKERERLTVLLHRGAAGEWDFEKLKDWSEDELLLWGFDACELVWIAREPKKKEPDLDDVLDRHAALRASYGVESGQLWKLGQHRLVCGDSRDPEIWKLLMGDEFADCAWTDPPYGVNYASVNASIKLKIENDDPDIAIDVFKLSMENCNEYIVSGYPIYIASPSGNLLIDFMKLFSDLKWHLSQVLVWVKINNHVLGRLDYHYRHEHILYGWKKGKTHPWFGGRDKNSVFMIPKPSRSADHPTTKPVRLIELHLCNSTEPGALVVDPFVGSGSTLIACDNLHRRCRAIDSDPSYVAVTLERWAKKTGLVPELV